MSDNFVETLAQLTMRRNSREAAARQATSSAENVSLLIEHVCNTASPLHRNASAVVELVAESDVNLITPYIDKLTSAFSHTSDETAIRSLSKVAMVLSGNKNLLSRTDTERLIAASFDWLIGPHKVAAKVYSMYALGNFSDNEWISTELKNILDKDYGSSSAAYKAGARKVLKKLDR